MVRIRWIFKEHMRKSSPTQQEMREIRGKCTKRRHAQDIYIVCACAKGLNNTLRMRIRGLTHVLT
jgi:hypothetical protein